MFTKIIYPLVLREKISYRIQKLYSRVNDRNISLEFNKKIKLDLLNTDVGHRWVIFNGFYELQLSKAIVKLGARGGIFVDVGANYGYFSCLWASKNSKNQVFAFEASPSNIEPLINNVTKNCLLNQIKIIPVALGKEAGELSFDLNMKEKQTGWGGFTINSNLSSVKVKVETLDNYAPRNNISKIDVLKIDTEGADTWVLYGSQKLLQEKKIKHIFFEENIARMELLKINRHEAQNFLEKYDYSVEKHSTTDFYAYPNI